MQFAALALRRRPVTQVEEVHHQPVGLGPGPPPCHVLHLVRRVLAGDVEGGGEVQVGVEALVDRGSAHLRLLGGPADHAAGGELLEECRRPILAVRPNGCSVCSGSRRLLWTRGHTLIPTCGPRSLQQTAGSSPRRHCALRYATPRSLVRVSSATVRRGSHSLRSGGPHGVITPPRREPSLPRCHPFGLACCDCSASVPCPAASPSARPVGGVSSIAASLARSSGGKANSAAARASTFPTCGISALLVQAVVQADCVVGVSA